MAAFVDYEYYSTQYGGAAIPPDEFDRFAARASRMLDALTLGRAGAMQDMEEIKDAACAAAEIFFSEDQRKKEIGYKASESVGSYSVSYRVGDEEQIEKSISGAAYDAARPYLFAAGLLYRGIC